MPSTHKTAGGHGSNQRSSEQHWSSLPDDLLGEVYVSIDLSALDSNWAVHMDTGDGSIQIQGTSSAADQWSSLPDDLLSMVYVRFPSPLDRVRFAAVCTSWRAVASTHPPRPVLPWLMLDPRGGDKTKRVYCPEDGTVLPRAPLPGEAAGRCFIGGHDGGWVASSEAPLGIVNLFSGAEVALSAEQRRIVRARQCTGDMLVMRKVVFSEAPTSSGCILAAITDKHGLALCRVCCPEGGWTTRGFHGEERLMDIAFCNGELYGPMRYTGWLLKFEIGVNEQGAPVLAAVHQLAIENFYSGGDPEEHVRYIVELRNKLVMAVRHPWWRRDIHWPSFTVLELVDGDGDDRSTAKWVKMTSLGDHALFLGPTCSTAVHVPAGGGRDGVKRNCIYYSHHRCLKRNDEIPKGAKAFLTSSIDDGDRVYYKSESIGDGVERITSVEYYVRGGARPPIWLLPPDI